MWASRPRAEADAWERERSILRAHFAARCHWLAQQLAAPWYFLQSAVAAIGRAGGRLQFSRPSFLPRPTCLREGGRPLSQWAPPLHPVRPLACQAAHEVVGCAERLAGSSEWMSACHARKLKRLKLVGPGLVFGWAQAHQHATCRQAPVMPCIVCFFFRALRCDLVRERRRQDGSQQCSR